MGMYVSPQAVKQTHRPGMKPDPNMGGHSGKVSFTPPPDDGVVYACTADTQYKIARGHVHILDDFVGSPVDHVPESWHMAHPGAEFQVAFFFDVNSSLFVHTMRFPDRGVFHRMIVPNGESFANMQRNDQERTAPLYRGYPEFQSSGKQKTGGHQENQAGRSQQNCS